MRNSKIDILQDYSKLLKLSSENKINTKNTWSLRLIDYMEDILTTQIDHGRPNFQLASCTLNASVQIYGTRVDSVYSDTYKILGGLNTTGHSVNEELEELKGKSKLEQKKMQNIASAQSTLELRQEEISLKQIEEHPLVDPIIQRALSNGDEGSLSASLMANLEMGVLGKLLFDVDQVEERNTLQYCVKRQDDEEDIGGAVISKEDEAQFEEAIQKIMEPIRICAVPVVDLSSFTTPPPQQESSSSSSSLNDKSLSTKATKTGVFSTPLSSTPSSVFSATTTKHSPIAYALSPTLASCLTPAATDNSNTTIKLTSYTSTPPPPPSSSSSSLAPSSSLSTPSLVHVQDTNKESVKEENVFDNLNTSQIPTLSSSTSSSSSSSSNSITLSPSLPAVTSSSESENKGEEEVQEEEELEDYDEGGIDYSFGEDDEEGGVIDLTNDKEKEEKAEKMLNLISSKDNPSNAMLEAMSIWNDNTTTSSEGEEGRIEGGNDFSSSSSGKREGETSSSDENLQSDTHQSPGSKMNRVFSAEMNTFMQAALSTKEPDEALLSSLMLTGTDNSDPYSFFNTTNPEPSSSPTFGVYDDKLKEEGEEGEMEKEKEEGEGEGGKKGEEESAEAQVAAAQEEEDDAEAKARKEEEELLKMINVPTHWKHGRLAQARKARQEGKGEEEEGEDMDGVFAGTKKGRGRKKKAEKEEEDSDEEGKKKGTKKKFSGPIDFSAPLPKKFLSAIAKREYLGGGGEKGGENDENDDLVSVSSQKGGKKGKKQKLSQVKQTKKRFEFPFLLPKKKSDTQLSVAVLMRTHTPRTTLLPQQVRLSTQSLTTLSLFPRNPIVTPPSSSPSFDSSSLSSNLSKFTVGSSVRYAEMRALLSNFAIDSTSPDVQEIGGNGGKGGNGGVGGEGDEGGRRQTKGGTMTANMLLAMGYSFGVELLTPHINDRFGQPSKLYNGLSSEGERGGGRGGRSNDEEGVGKEEEEELMGASSPGPELDGELMEQRVVDAALSDPMAMNLAMLVPPTVTGGSSSGSEEGREDNKNNNISSSTGDGISTTSSSSSLYSKEGEGGTEEGKEEGDQGSILRSPGGVIMSEEAANALQGVTEAGAKNEAVLDSLIGIQLGQPVEQDKEGENNNNNEGEGNGKGGNETGETTTETPEESGGFPDTYDDNDGYDGGFGDDSEEDEEDKNIKHYNIVYEPLPHQQATVAMVSLPTFVAENVGGEGGIGEGAEEKPDILNSSSSSAAASEEGKEKQNEEGVKEGEGRGVSSLETPIVNRTEGEKEDNNNNTPNTSPEGNKTEEGTKPSLDLSAPLTTHFNVFTLPSAGEGKEGAAEMKAEELALIRSGLTKTRTMIQQPAGVSYLVLHFEVVPKKVDMHRLKRGVWTGLKRGMAESKEKRMTLREKRMKKMNEKNNSPSSLGRVFPSAIPPQEKEEIEEESRLCKHSFRDTLNFLPSFLPPVQLKETSVHLAFLCLLHIAHERNLVLTQEIPANTTDHSELFTDSDIIIQSEEEYSMDPLREVENNKRRPRRELKKREMNIFDEDD